MRKRTQLPRGLLPDQHPKLRFAKAKPTAELPNSVVRCLEDCWLPRNEAEVDRYDPDELATLPPRSREGSPDLAGFSDEAPAEEAPDYADPLETSGFFPTPVREPHLGRL